MPNVDGSIRIGTKIETREAKKELAGLEKDIKETASEISRAQKEIENVKVSTKKYEALQKSIEKNKFELESLVEKQKELSASGFGKDIDKDYLTAARAVKNLKFEMQQAIEAGDKDAYLGIEDRLNRAKSVLQELMAKEPKPLGDLAYYESIENRIGEVKNNIANAESAIKSFSESEKAFTVDPERYSEASARISELTQKMQSDQQRVAELQSFIASEEQRLVDIKANAVAVDDEIIAKVERIRQLEKEIADLKAAGVTEGYQDYDDRTRELTLLKQDVREYRDSLSEVPEKFSQMYSSAQKAFDAIFSGLSKIGSFGKKAFSTIFSFAKKAFSAITRGSKQSNASLSGGFKTILKYGLGIRSLYVLFNKIRSGIQEGFKNLMGYSDDFANNIQSVKNSMATLGNQIAGAFRPIIDMVVPWLNSLINALTTAMTYVAQFIAVVGGRSTWTKAVAIQDKYADSLNGTAAAAEKAAGALADFDTLDVLNKKNAGGGAGAGGTLPEDMFQEVPVDGVFEIDPYEVGKDLSNKLLEALQEIDWDEIKAKAHELGEKLASFLNGIFENEELAAELGRAIGESLNTVVEFLDGFVDKFKWEQFGRWLGTLIQNGLDTFDEEKAGEVAGKLGNGLADAIIGFFQTYEAGSLGAEIAGFLNRAVETIDAEKFGTAASLLIGGLLKEISTFFEDLKANEIGKKISQMFIRFFTYAAEDGTVGQKAGEALAAIVNAGVEFLINLDVSGMAGSLAEFLTDMVITAVSDIDWVKVAQMLFKGITSLVDLPSELGKGVGKGILRAMGIDEETIAEADEKVMSLGDIMDNLNSKIVSFVSQNEAMKGGQIFDVSDLERLQEELGLLDSDIDAIIQSMMDANSQLDLSSLGLEGYNGSWETFKTTLSETTNLVDAFKQKNNEMTGSLEENFEKVSTSSESASERVHTSFNRIGENTGGLKEKMSELSSHTALVMDGVSEKTSNAGNSFGKLNSDASESLDNTSSKLDSWFSGSIEPYFSAEQWNSFSQNITQAMSECIDLFIENWNTRLNEWKTNNETLYFGYDYWYTTLQNIILAFSDVTEEFSELWTEFFVGWSETNLELYFGYEIWYEQFSNILLAYNDVNAQFMTEWQNNMNTWWTTMVMPFFEVAKWQAFGTQMKKGIINGFKVIVNEIGGLLNKIIAMFNAAFEELEEAMNDLIDDYNKSASALGTSKLSHVHYNPMGGVKIPALASGAVIRGGNPFMAILGDQRVGQTNVEAPAGLIKDMVSQGISEANIGRESVPVTINLNWDGETFARISISDILSELKRQGYDVDVLGVT